MHSVIVEIAKKEDYDLVVTQPVLFASSRIDLTERVLQELQGAQ
jgi:Skp family chaperone for outer membrane proteins